MTESTKFHYLLVNRGRYICEQHGSFCDECDGYLQVCPLCKTENIDRAKWNTNHIDRLLQIVNGLQKRSQRNMAIVASIVGGIGALKILSEMLETTPLQINSIWFFVPLLLAILFFLLSLWLYAGSMGHIKVTEYCSIPAKSVDEWEKDLSIELSKLESRHTCAGNLLAVGILFLAVATIFLIIVSVNSSTP